MEHKEHQHLFIVNKNDTMVPTLRYGDVARLEPCEGSRLRRGDVVCFYRSIDHGWISRVVEVGPDGVRARGDNAAMGDTWLIQPENVIGRVVWAYRGNRRVAVPNGKAGRLAAMSYRVLHAVESWFSPLLRKVYHGLSRNGLCRRWLPRELTPRTVAFERAKGTEYQVLMGRRVVGQRLPGKEWRIWRPFRLFVEEKSLPR